MKTLYDQLGVTAQASQKAIQQAFFRLAQKFDAKNLANQGNADAGARYRAVHNAYRILSDIETRRKYDQNLPDSTLTQRLQIARAMRNEIQTESIAPGRSR